MWNKNKKSHRLIYNQFIGTKWCTISMWQVQAGNISVHHGTVISS